MSVQQLLIWGFETTGVLLPASSAACACSCPLVGATHFAHLALQIVLPFHPLGRASTVVVSVPAAWNMDAAVFNECLLVQLCEQAFRCSLYWDFLGETQTHQAACNLRDSVKE